MGPDDVKVMLESMLPPKFYSGEVVARSICRTCQSHDPTTDLCRSPKRCRHFKQFLPASLDVFLQVIPDEVARAKHRAR